MKFAGRWRDCCNSGEYEDHEPDCDEAPPLWGPEGPKEGQVIQIRGTGMYAVWTNGHWERVHE